MRLGISEFLKSNKTNILIKNYIKFELDNRNLEVKITKKKFKFNIFVKEMEKFMILIYEFLKMKNVGQ